MKHLKYLRYVLRHKWFVFLACLRYGLIWQGIMHDWSKFLPSEWLPYANYFYGDFSWGNGVLKPPHIIQGFNVAWNEHQKRNKHHWQYWLLRLDTGEEVVLPMPKRYWQEMLADWNGAGRALGTPDTLDWYMRNKDRIILHPDTRQNVEFELGIYAYPEAQ